MIRNREDSGYRVDRPLFRGLSAFVILFLGLSQAEAEWRVLPTLIACRIAVSLCVGAYSSAKDPTNEYLKLTLLPGLKALRALRATPRDNLETILRRAGA